MYTKCFKNHQNLEFFALIWSYTITMQGSFTQTAPACWVNKVYFGRGWVPNIWTNFFTSFWNRMPALNSVLKVLVKNQIYCWLNKKTIYHWGEILREINLTLANSCSFWHTLWKSTIKCDHTQNFVKSTNSRENSLFAMVKGGFTK